MCTYNFSIVSHNPNKVLFYYIYLILVTINISSNTFCGFKCLALKQNIGNLISKLEKAMATNSSTLAWKVPWAEEPGRLQSTGSRRVRHDIAASLSLFTFMHWRRKWQPIPVFLPRESQGLRSLVGCRLWGRTESDTTEVT